jgi:hypothetical protein
MEIAALTAPPPACVEISSASVLRPSSSSRNDASALRMLMRSIRALSIMAMESTIAPPIVSTFMTISF